MKPKTFYQFLKPGNIEYLKVFLVLFYKKFSWQKELELEFSISTKIVPEAILTMEKESIITSRDFWNLSIDDQEAISKLNAGYLRKINTYPKIYTLNQQGTELYNMYKEEIGEIIQKNENLKETISFIAEKTEAYNHLKKENRLKDKIRTYRERIDPQTGLIFWTESETHKEMKKSIKEAVKQLKKEELARIGNKKGTSLAHIKKNELGFVKENYNTERRITYNGENMNPSDMDRIFQAIEEADKEIEKSKIVKGYKANKDNDYDYNKFSRKLKGKSLYEILKLEKGREETKEIFNLNDSEKKIEICEDQRNLFDALTNRILHRKKVSFLTIERLCETKENLEAFYEYKRLRNLHR